jgi:hypothetical protein
LTHSRDCGAHSPERSAELFLYDILRFAGLSTLGIVSLGSYPSSPPTEYQNGICLALGSIEILTALFVAVALIR